MIAFIIMQLAGKTDLFSKKELIPAKAGDNIDNATVTDGKVCNMPNAGDDKNKSAVEDDEGCSTRNNKRKKTMREMFSSLSVISLKLLEELIGRIMEPLEERIIKTLRVRWAYGIFSKFTGNLLCISGLLTTCCFSLITSSISIILNSSFTFDNTFSIYTTFYMFIKVFLTFSYSFHTLRQLQKNGRMCFVFCKEVFLSENKYFDFINVYYPNGGMGDERLSYKLAFYDAFLDYVNDLRDRGFNLVICGDLNTAHKPIDLYHPKSNENVSGFLPIEREWVTKFLDNGYVDTFRMFNQEPYNYTWWSYRTKARDRNVGWRLDYFFVNEEFKDCVKSSTIMSDVMGSDHCPICLELEI